MAAQAKVIWMGLAVAALEFGLAVLGWGGFGAFFAHRALVALVVATIGLMLVAPFTGGSLSSGKREDRGNRWALAAFLVIGLLASYLPALTDRKDLGTIGGDAIRWVGIFFYATGGALRLWPVYVLGRRFSGLVAIQPGHTLETHGPYSLIRNPSYLGMLINVTGWVLAFRSGVGLVLVALLLVPLLARIHAEERLLHTHFGADYDAYRARTWRLVPWLY